MSSWKLGGFARAGASARLAVCMGRALATPAGRNIVGGAPPVWGRGMTETERLIRAYYEAFVRGDRDGMLSLLTEDVAHDVNQGERQAGKEAFRSFLGHMDHSYREGIEELAVM